MFMVVHCSFFDDPNEIFNWEFEKRIGTFFFTKEEAIEAGRKVMQIVRDGIALNCNNSIIRL